jgi:nicastrin
MLVRGNATSYSPDSTTPQRKYGLYANEPNSHPWNPRGLDLLSKDIPVPIFEIPSFGTDNSTIALELALQYNQRTGYSGSPLYGMQFMLHMWSAKSSAKCLSRKYCQPIESVSIWSSFSDVPNDSKPIIVVSTKLDSNALIRESSFGYAGRTGPLLLLAMANALRGANVTTLPKSILFSFFGAEQWGFAGSQRFVQDISQDFVCQTKGPTEHCNFSGESSCANPCHFNTEFRKIKLDRIDSVIDIDTVGSLYGDPAVATTHYVHIDRPSDATNALAQSFQTNFTIPSFNGSTAGSGNLVPARDDATGLGLPPSSAMSFLQRKRSIPAIVISDYKSEFSNPFFNSEFDRKQDWTSQHVSLLCGLATSMSRSLYRTASGTEAPSSIAANCTLVNELFDCMTRNFSCPIMFSIFNRTLPSTQHSYAFNSNAKLLDTLVYSLMAQTTASEREGPCGSGCKVCRVNIAWICVSRE